MKRRRFVHALAVTAALSFPHLTSAGEPEKVNRQPPEIPNPYLLLIRDPDVHRELKLTRKEVAEIRDVTDEIDGPLLSTRNKSSAAANEILNELIEQTENRIYRVLPANKRARLEQIILQARGSEVILLPENSQKLQLTDAQYTQIQGIVKDARNDILELQKRMRKEGSTKAILNQIEDRRKDAKTDVIKALTRSQRSRWSSMLGKRISTAQFGDGLVFRAPEISPSEDWINSKPLTLASLRGRVVAVHFYAFG